MNLRQNLCGYFCNVKKTNSIKNQHKNKKDFQHQLYFEKGKHKLTKDLDIERIMRNMHGFEALRSVIMNKHDRYLLEYTKQRVIETNSESSHHHESSDAFRAG